MRLLAAVAVLLCLCGTPALAQDDAQDQQQVRQLLSANKFGDAVPILERMVAAHPGDGKLWRTLGLALAGHSETITELPLRKATRQRAREALLKARGLGVNDDLLEVMLNSLPPDGSGGSQFDSKVPQANQLMLEGQAAFSKGDFDQAEVDYAQAFIFDPTLYEAALFRGDVSYRKKDWAGAEEWFGKAVKVDARRETAYRYWGDMLLTQGRRDEAKLKYLEAVVAEPYGRFSWKGLANWASASGVSARHPQFPGLNNSVIKKEGDKFTVFVDPSSDASTLIMSYAMSRVLWQTKKYAEQFPGQAYRHTLVEEVDALNSTAQVAVELQQSKKLKAPTWLADLLRLREAGLLEAYVLLGRPDGGTARDYAAYRQAHPEKLRQYLIEVYLAK